MAEKIPWHTRPYKDDPKHYDILFCGDSWTWGGELDTDREDCRWSSVVSKITGKSNYNLSNPGESNDWITRALVDWFECGNHADTAVVQFTYHVRQSYWSEERGKLISLKPETIARKQWHKDPFVKYYKDYFENCYTDYNGYQMYSKNLCLIDSYLKNKGVKPVYITIQPEQYGFPLDYFAYYAKNIVVKNLRELIGTSDTNPENYVEEGFHPNIKGHSIIADYITSQL